MSRSNSTLLIVLLVIFAFPAWLGIFGALFGLVAGIFGAAIGLVAGIFGGILGIFAWPFSHSHIAWPFSWPFLIALIFFVAILTRKSRKKA